MEPTNMNNKDIKGQNPANVNNPGAKITNMPKDKTAVNNLKNPNVDAQGNSCPVDVTKDVSYMPPKDENTL